MRIQLYIAFVGILCFAMGCSRNSSEPTMNAPEEETSSNTSLSLTPREYVIWVRDKENHLVKEKNIDEIKFSSLYKPYNYIVCNEQKTEEIKSTTLSESIKQLEGMVYFDLKIAIEDGQGELLKHKLSSPQEYQNRVEYYAFKMQKDIDLVNGLDTIPCALFHFERTYDIAPYSNFILGFSAKDVKKMKKDFSLVFHDKVFGKGIIQFHYTKEELSNVPKLKTI